jgi:hypothetical protein
LTIGSVSDGNEEMSHEEEEEEEEEVELVLAPET